MILKVRQARPESIIAVIGIIVLLVFALAIIPGSPVQQYLSGVRIKFRFTSGWPSDTRLSPDGKMVAISRPGMQGEFESVTSLLIFNVDTGSSVAELKADPRPMKFSPDGKFLATGFVDAEIRLWDTNTWQMTAKFPIDIADILCDMTYSPDSRFLLLAACGGGHSGVQVINVMSQQRVKQLTKQGGGETAAAYSLDGQFIMTTYTPYVEGKDQDTTTVIIWDSHTLEEVRRFELPESAICLAWLPDNNSFTTVRSPYRNSLSSDTKDSTAKPVAVDFWDATTGKKLRQIDHSGPVLELSYSRDGRILAVGGTQSVDLWNTATWQQISSFPTAKVRTLDFGRDNTSLAVIDYAEYRGTATVYDISEMLKRSK